MNVTDILMNSVYGIGGSGGSPSLQSKTATPTKQSQNVQPDSGYDGLSQVTVEAIPARYPDVSGDTAVESDVAQGKTFHKADGSAATGTAIPSAGVDLEKRIIGSNDSYSVKVTKSVNVPVTIKGFAFYRDVNLSDFEVETQGIVNIGSEAFFYCTGLKSVKGNCLYLDVQTNAFNGCNYLEDVVGIINPSGNACFNDCYKLKISQISSPSKGGFTNVGDSAFNNCRALENLDIYGYCMFGKLGFKNCSNLEKVVFHGNVNFSTNSYLNRQFLGCDKLKTIRFKGSVVNGKFANPGGSSLQNVYFEQTPSSLDSDLLSGSNTFDIWVPWSEGAVSGAPWGATNATIHYDTVYDANGDPIV